MSKCLTNRMHFFIKKKQTSFYTFYWTNWIKTMISINSKTVKNVNSRYKCQNWTSHRNTFIPLRWDENNLLLNCDQDAEKRFEDAVDQFNVQFNETTVGAETSLGEILSQLTNWFQVLKKKDLNIYNSGQNRIGPGSCVLYTVFFPLLLPPSLHHLLQALSLSFLLQVNFTKNLKSQISCAGCPAALSCLVDQEATAAREGNRLLKTSLPPLLYGGSGS